MKEHKNSKKKMSGLRMSLVLMTVIPMLILGISVSFFVYRRFTKIMYKEENIILQNVALIISNTYENAYPGDYRLIGKEEVAIVKGDKVLNGNYEIIDDVKEETGCEITFFYENVRVLTTICDDKGNRIVGSTARQLVYNQVMESGESKFYSNSLINNKNYFSYYMPVFNENGNAVGMIGISKSAEKINSEIRKGVLPILIIVFAAIVIMAAISYRYTDELIKRIRKVEKFLKKTAKGEFSVKIDEKELAKNDEISDMEKSAVSMQKSLRKLIEQDSLTEINNRRYGSKFLIETQNRCLKEGVKYCIAIADIDYFKKVNDTYGHEAGDKVLVEVAGVLKSSMVGKGFVARWGGEEFLLVFDKYDIDRAYDEIKNIMNKISKRTIKYNDNEIKVTMTAGITEGTDEPIHIILNKADRKLYNGKQNGRNKVIK